MEREILPRWWYNIAPDLPRPLPPPIDPPDSPVSLVDRLKEILPGALIDQEFTFERYVEIPEEVRKIYAKMGRPTPLVRARKLERVLDTPARIYYKYEGILPSGSHKLNTAVAQAYYASREGYREVFTETGAGQWGLAVAIASKMVGISSTIYMTRSSYEGKRRRVELMRAHGAEVIPSPSNTTSSGSKILASEPDHPGSLGIAIGEAVEKVLENPRARRYLPGSVMEYVLLHQTVIGLEAVEQLKILDEFPSIVVGCVGGGSNLAGLSYPFYKKALETGESLRIVAAESSLVPKLTRGVYRYEHPDTFGILPMLKMHTVGRDFKPPAIRAAGLRFHGVASSLSILVSEGLVEARAYSPEEAKRAGELFREAEGILPAPESAHAVAAAVQDALRARRLGEKISILIGLSGHGEYDEDFYRG